MRFDDREAPGLLKDLLPTITTPLGAEGLFGQSYDGNADISGFSPDSRFFKPEPVEVIENRVLQTFYNDRVIHPQIDDLKFGGEFRIRSAQGFADNILRMHKDEEFWHKKLLEGADILSERFNIQRYQRMLNYRMTEYLQNIQDMRNQNPRFQAAWDKHLNISHTKQ